MLQLQNWSLRRACVVLRGYSESYIDPRYSSQLAYKLAIALCSFILFMTPFSVFSKGRTEKKTWWVIMHKSTIR